MKFQPLEFPCLEMCMNVHFLGVSWYCFCVDDITVWEVGGLLTIHAGNVCRLNTMRSMLCFQITSLNVRQGQVRVCWERGGNRLANSWLLAHLGIIWGILMKLCLLLCTFEISQKMFYTTSKLGVCSSASLSSPHPTGCRSYSFL